MADDLDLIQRVSSRYLKAITFPRNTWVPEAVREMPPMQPEGTDLAIWSWEDKGRIWAIAFAGKSNKPLWYHYFSNESGRRRKIDDTIKSRREFIERKETERRERLEFQHSFKVGDFIDTSWGYDQTNIDYYQVVGVRGKMLLVRKVSEVVVESKGDYDMVVPKADSFIGGVLKVLPSKGDKVKVEGHYGSKWDGRPNHQTSSFAGH